MKNAYKPAIKWNFKRNYLLYLMLIPAVIQLLIFHYYPIYGIVIAFQDFQPAHGFLGSKFVGLDWFKMLLNMPDFYQILYNTVFIAVCKIIVNGITPIIFALLLNEVKNAFFKRTIQTLVYLPHFLSWVIIGGLFIDILSTNGAVNQVLALLGFEKVFFLGSNAWFRPTLIITDAWKSFGWGAIIYLAAIAGVDTNLYESSVIDGANRWEQTIHITLPAMLPTIILVFTLSLGGILNAGFEQVLMLYNPVVYKTGDILDTFLYRTGLIDAQFSLSAAVGLFKSVIGFIMILISYRLAYKYADYRIF
jgi:putative aldouronate transport system permease protein